MILIASIVGGAVTGYLLGAGRRGTRLFLILWLVVFAGQTVLLLATSDDPRNRDTGAWNLGYFPFSLTVFAFGYAILHGAAALGRRRRVNAPVADPRLPNLAGEGRPSTFHGEPRATQTSTDHRPRA